jgi:hypothetical protein
VRLEVCGRHCVRGLGWAVMRRGRLQVSGVTRGVGWRVECLESEVRARRCVVVLRDVDAAVGGAAAEAWSASFPLVRVGEW